MSKNIPQRQHTVKSETNDPQDPAGLPTRTPEGDAWSALVVQIFRLNGLLLASGDALAETAGQTSARWRVLAAVEDHPMSVAQIARRWGLARQSVQRVANVLVREGLAVYQENPNHRRAQLLVLTPQGLDVLRTIQAVQRDWANALGAEFGVDDLHQAIALLTRVLKVVEERG